MSTTLERRATVPTRKTDRRHSRRLDVRWPVRFSIAESIDSPAIGGVTRNVSSGGTYFECGAHDCRPGDRLSIELTLPASEGALSREARGHCEADVVRVDPLHRDGEVRPSRMGVAARFLQSLRIDL
jgi:hypothetical protein